jgi:hypothetical protein
VVVNYRYGTGIDFVFDDNVLSVLPDSGFPDPDISIPDLGSRVKKARNWIRNKELKYL